MSYAKKLILHAPPWDSPALSEFVEACIRDNVSLVCVIGHDCERVHDVIDELIVGDGSNPARWEFGPVTAGHEGQTLEEVRDFARQWEIEGVASGTIEEVRLIDLPPGLIASETAWIDDYYGELVRQDIRSNQADKLIEKLNDPRSPDERRLLLIYALMQLKLFDEARYEQLFEETIKEFPDDSHLWSGHANFYRIQRNDPARALEYLEKALEIAYRKRHFRRSILGDKARIAIDLRDRALWLQAVDEIACLDFLDGDFDFDRERDFFDAAPNSLKSSEIGQRYAEFLTSARKPNEPDAWQPSIRT
jgi:tetratricopeptide (TPR) repeat protein